MQSLRDIARSRLLVAEDDELLREVLCEGLADQGFEVVPASDGVHALERVEREGPFDLLLLDEEMPRLTGRRLLAELRGRGHLVPALLMSGNLAVSDAERVALGVAEVLRKPLRILELSAAIHAALRRS